MDSSPWAVPWVRGLAVGCGALAFVVPNALAGKPPEVVTRAPTEVGFSQATFNGTVTPNGDETRYVFQYGTADFDLHTPVVVPGDGREPVAVSAQVHNLAADTVYRVRLVAFNDRRVTTGEAIPFRTQAPPPPTSGASQQLPAAAPPILGERVNVDVRSGTVSVRPPGADRFVALSARVSIPVGSLVNARHGSVLLRTARSSGGTQSGTFRDGLFEVRQRAGTKGMTELVLRGRRPTCRRATTAVASTHRRTRRRSLWGNVRRGNFRIRGDNSVATVRGTVWNVQDRCDGTLTRVRRGSVRVRDFRRNRTVVVRAGSSYLARRR